MARPAGAWPGDAVFGRRSTLSGFAREGRARVGISEESPATGLGVQIRPQSFLIKPASAANGLWVAALPGCLAAVSAVCWKAGGRP